MQLVLQIKQDIHFNNTLEPYDILVVLSVLFYICMQMKTISFEFQCCTIEIERYCLKFAAWDSVLTSDETKNGPSAKNVTKAIWDNCSEVR